MKKIILFILAIVLVWFAYDQIKNKPIELNEITAKKEGKPDKKNDGENSNKSTSDQAVSMKSKANGLPEGQLFHEDAMIDLFTGLNHFAPCHTYYSDKPEDQEDIHNLNTQQNQYLEPFFIACEEEKDLFELYDKDKIMSKLMVHGLQLKQQKESFDKNPDRFLAYMSQADGYEMLIAFDLTNNHIRSQIIPEIKSLLDIKNHKVLELILDEAMMVMACDRGVDCSYVSGMMMNRCMENENACGLSFTQYVENHYLPGIKQEILTAAKFLSDHFNL